MKVKQSQITLHSGAENLPSVSQNPTRSPQPAPDPQSAFMAAMQDMLQDLAPGIWDEDASWDTAEELP
ncbi:MAG: hypothetical protein KF690_01110 [Bacteroidetes bacterium]|nr:hypothetical protein [Bacteroidota bacterium]